MSIEWLNTTLYSFGMGFELVAVYCDEMINPRCLFKMMWWQRGGLEIDLLFIHVKRGV